jgi:hypothetical protein
VKHIEEVPMTQTHQPYGEHAAQHAAEVASRTRTMLEARTGGPFLLAPMASVAVAALGFWLWVSNPVLSTPFSAGGWDTALRDEGISILVILAGLAMVWRPGNRVAAVVAVAGGLALLALGTWAHHDVARATVNELGTGFAIVVATLIATLAASRHRRC